MWCKFQFYDEKNLLQKNFKLCVSYVGKLVFWLLLLRKASFLRWWINPLFALETIPENNARQLKFLMSLNSSPSKRVKCSEISLFFRELSECAPSGDWTNDNHQQKTHFFHNFLKRFHCCFLLSSGRLSYAADNYKVFLIIFLRETLRLNELIVLAGFNCDCARIHQTKQL